MTPKRPGADGRGQRDHATSSGSADRPIGVYDSGFGGLSVLRSLQAHLPGVDFLYLGDSGRAPYGGRSADTILDFAEQATERLFEEGCRVIVVACNTVSCVALRHLQHRYAPLASGGDRRILGVTIPAAELVVSTGARAVGVLATARTVASGTYVTEIHKLDPSVRVVQRSAPLLAPIVEEGWEDTAIAEDALRRYLADLDGCDAILLGCTHYPLLAPAIGRVVEERVRIIDPSETVGRRLADWVERHPELAPGRGGTLRVMCSGDTVRFAEHGARFLGRPLPRVEPVAEVHGRLVPAATTVPARGQVVR